MAKTIKCPMCASMHAFNQALLKYRGVFQSYDQKSCKYCGGYGEVLELPRPYEKPRKELTGPEWMEREYQDEWNHYVTFERVIE
jgi:hypothetical protein